MNNNTDFTEMASKVGNKVASYGIKGVAIAVACAAAYNSVAYNPGGVSTRTQMPIFGYSWITEEGYYGKFPFITRTSEWNQRGTVAGTDLKSLVDAASIVVPPSVLQFADSYEMAVEWSMRYEIPSHDEGLEKMYTTLKSQKNMLGNTLMPFAQTLVNDSVNQMLGGDFAQGGRNALRTLIDNQSQFGMYQTKVEKVSNSRKTGKGSNEVTGGTAADNLEITKVVYLTDTSGKKLRTPLALSQYGIKIVPNSISIVETQPRGRLVNYIQKKQDNLALQIEQDENQKLLAKQAKTKQLEGEKNLVVRTNELNIEKQVAIINKEREVAEATLQAEREVVEREKVAKLAIIDKNRELQVSEANEGIQKANATAARYEAEAIKSVGFAQAAVKKADYAAIDKDILVSNNNRAVAEAMYKSGMNVQMPTYLNIGGGKDGAAGSIADMSNMYVMKALQQNTGSDSAQ